MTSVFDYNIVGNPKIFEQNRLMPHTEKEDFVYDSECDEWISNRFLNLNGVWEFCYSNNYKTAPKFFEEIGYDCKAWDKIKVPGHIQMQGYDVPHYTNTAYPWDGKENVKTGELPKKFNPVGSYVKYFDISDKWLGKQIRISFQGVESGAAVWLNGSYVGYFENSFDPAEFDISDYIRIGENKLAVQVFKWTAGSWCEDQDFFRFSGIYRDVYLYVVPEIHVEDITINTLFDNHDFTRSSLEIMLETNGRGNVNFTLIDNYGMQVFSETLPMNTKKHIYF